MKFLLQKIDGEIRHDFVFTLREHIRVQNEWFPNKYNFKFFNTKEEQKEFLFKNMHEKYVPVGSVEFVRAFLQQFYGLTPKPQNVPEELFIFAGRKIWNGVENDFKCDFPRYTVKSNDVIKGFREVGVSKNIDMPKGNYQYSEYITIDSEWRCFVFNGKLIGLNHYSGEFTLFPNLFFIKNMIAAFKSAPVAYTLDIGVQEDHNNTVVVEVHDFFSCGLYGFNSLKYSAMLHQWFYQYVQKEMWAKRQENCNKFH